MWETTALTNSDRKSKYKSTENAGARQLSHSKKQTIAVGRHVLLRGNTSRICLTQLPRHSQSLLESSDS
jgi:hypothetical protein